jgi:hypothetical protein
LPADELRLRYVHDFGIDHSDAGEKCRC